MNKLKIGLAKSRSRKKGGCKRLIRQPLKMRDRAKKILLGLCGQPGAHLATLFVMGVVLPVGGYSGRLIIEMAAGLTLIRVAFYLTRGPLPVLTAYRVRKRIQRVMADEIRISVALAAACFVMLWPVTMFNLAWLIAANLVAQMAVVAVSRYILRQISRMADRSGGANYRRQTIIVGTGERARRAADMIIDSPELDTLVIGFLDYRKDGLWRYRDLPLIGHADDLAQIAATCQIDALIMAVEPEDIHRTRGLFMMAEEMGLTVCVLPEFYRPRLSRVRPTYLNGMPTLVYRAVPENQVLLFVKSIVDRLGALCGLTLAAPIMLASAIAIKLESKGPVFFRQTRSGLNGKPFRLFKFRTMCDNAEALKADLADKNEMSGPVFKIKEDPRVTRVGRLLRKTSIDEIPQFINVLNGDMSLVGPRPPLPKEVAQYEPWQRRKLSVRPGVTCTWQVNGRNEVDFDDWMRLDLQYIDNWSLWQDTKILAKTVPAVMKGSGAS